MTEPVELHPDAVDDRAPHRVAMVVFATVNAVDQVDADQVVRQALIQEFLTSPRRVDAPRGRYPTIRHAPRHRDVSWDVSWDVTIGSLVALRHAVTGGYVKITPTDHAFPHDRPTTEEEP